MSVVSLRCVFQQVVEQEEPKPKKRLRRAQQAEQEAEEPGTAAHLPLRRLHQAVLCPHQTPLHLPAVSGSSSLVLDN